MTSPPERRWFSFRLRTLLIAVLVIGLMLPLCQFGWQCFVASRTSREYAARLSARPPIKQAIRQYELPTQRLTPTSHIVDKGRPISDNTIILVRRGDVFGCFIPRQQQQNGESLKYEWYFRTDGQGRFSANDPNVQSGESPGGPVTFGPFSIEWSGHKRGWGFLYYGEAKTDDGSEPVRICTTNLRALENLDARSAKWLYKVDGDDVGLPGDVNGKSPESQQQQWP